MLKILQHRPTLYMVLLVFLTLCFCTDVVPVSIMEARNFITAREIINDGNWLLTTMNGEARYQKPPLPTWITAVFGLVFGLKNIVALRLPSILFVSIIGIFTYALSKKLHLPTAQGFINGLLVVTSFYVIGITLEEPWDIFAHGFMLMGIYYLFQLFGNETGISKYAILAGIFIGCSILSKGPISIYVLLFPFILAYGLIYQFKGFKSKLFWVLGCFILALMVGCWWFVYARLNDPHTFEAMATRETNNWQNYNTKPFYYYWSFFTQSGIWTIPAFISLVYPYLKNRVSNLKAYQFSWLWTILAVVLLSLIPEKKSRYLMPVLIPLAINTGFYIEYLIRNFKTVKDKKETIPVYFNFGLIAMIAISFPVVLYFLVGEGISKNWLLFAVTDIITVGSGILILIHLKKKHIENVFLLTVAFYVSIFLFALPILKPVIGTENNPITNLKATHLKIYGFNYIPPEMIWQFGSKIPPMKSEDGTIYLPSETQFGMLGININYEDWAILQTHYDIQKVNTFDLNTVPKDSKRHNDRLVKDFYILTRL